jgi:NAD(P)-dependent dehydrogenase (short-subunit alcohol dehydrogenase family)
MTRTRTARPAADRVVAITGGGRGIGRASAAAFLAAGAKVAIGDLDGELAARTAAELATSPGARVVGLALDVTDRASFAGFLDAAEAELGPLDVLVNNAGIMPTGMFADELDAMTDRMIEINLRGVITGAKLALARFLERGGGCIVNVASLAGLLDAPGIATYCATKSAVITFSRALDRELRGRGTRVSVVLPGVVNTELSAGANYPRWMNRIAAVEPAEVADAIVTASLGGATRVFVPRSLSLALRALSLLPAPARGWAERRMGLERAFTQPDPVARGAYHRRVVGDRP